MLYFKLVTKIKLITEGVYQLFALFVPPLLILITDIHFFLDLIKGKTKIKKIRMTSNVILITVCNISPVIITLSYFINKKTMLFKKINPFY